MKTNELKLDSDLRHLTSIKDHIALALEYLAQLPGRDEISPTRNAHTKDTASRVARMLIEMTEGYDDEQLKAYSVWFSASPTYGEHEKGDLIFTGPIVASCLCPHHLMPAKLTHYIGYVNHTANIGLSKLPRIAKHLSRRLEVQESITQRIARHIYNSHAGNKFVAVRTVGEHSCAGLRGVGEETNFVTEWQVRNHYPHNRYDEWYKQFQDNVEMTKEK